MSVTALTESTFESVTSTGITLVDFWAPWCMPCKAMLPILDKLAQETENLSDVTVGKVNVDEAGALAQRFSVSSIPTLMLFKDGQPVKTMVGMQTAAVLLDLLKQHTT